VSALVSAAASARLGGTLVGGNRREDQRSLALRRGCGWHRGTSDQAHGILLEIHKVILAGRAKTSEEAVVGLLASELPAAK
jgi:hypothetical protein